MNQFCSFRSVVFFCLLLLSGLSFSQTYTVASPDGNTTFEIAVNEHKQLVYRVLYAKEPVVNWSEAGFQLSSVRVGADTRILKQSRKKVKEEFRWLLGENDLVKNHYEELILSCRSGSVDFLMTTRVFDGSVAFRYELPEQKGSSPGRILKEYTTFNLAGPSVIYEYHEESVFTPVQVDSMLRSCDFPATLTSPGRFISIGEADNRNYTKAVLSKGTLNNSLAVSFKKDSVTTSGSFTFPWRTISVASSAIGLHQFSDLPLRLCTPSAAEVPAWIKPGKLIRSSLTTQGGINCIDFAAAHNFSYIMFDAGWYGAEFNSVSDPTKPIDAIDMAKVISYGKEKGIGVILYVNRVGLRARLDELLPLYKKWGVAGFKFGFVDGLSHEGLTWLSSAMKKVYDHGFVLNIHDNYKPTGLSRTFPNLLTQEGIRGNENNPDAYHNTVLPFTRFLAGAGDYTYCYPNTNRYFTDNLLKSKLQVSKGQQLALSVIYFSPLQAIFWYGNPVDYNDETEIEFFKRVPTVWNESKYLQGEIGKYISVARRSGSVWYVGSVAGLEDWKGVLPLDFLTEGKTYKATVFEDNAASGITKRTVNLKKNDGFPIELKAKGGQALFLEEQ